jgi:hypothetical chaperone protein
MQAYLSGTEGRLLRSLKSLLGSRLMDEYTAVNGQSMRFFDIVVLFFKELKRRCEAQVGPAAHRAMLGRPVHFVDDDPERDAMAQATLGRAAQEGRLHQIAFQLEPIAAALDYEQRVDSVRPRPWWWTLAGAPPTSPSSASTPHAASSATAD